MTPRLSAGVLLLALAAGAAAQPKLLQGLAKDGPADPPERPKETAYAMTLRAAGQPLPAMKHELLPTFRDQTRNNAALLYHRALHLMSENRKPGKETGEAQIKIEELLNKPLKDIPVEELRAYLKPFPGTFRELEAAAKCRDCDWGLSDRIAAEQIALLLPEMQKCRELAFLLKVRCRLHLAEGNVDAALRDIQTGLAMGRHVGRSETLISFLVGNAITAIMLNELHPVMQAPKSPNLYWALTALPQPLMPLEAAMEGEMRSLDGMIALPRDLDEPMTAEQARLALDNMWARMQKWSGELGAGNVPRMGVNESRFFLAAYVTMTHPTAKKNLLAAGKTEAELAAMPAAQVVLLDATVRYRNVRDQFMVWMFKPHDEAVKGMKMFEDTLKAMRQQPADYLNVMLGLLMPAVHKVYDSQQRTERRVASLRVVEAVRLHTAKTGKAPATLDDITLVPVPADPTTGKPFAYAVTDGGFTVAVGPPAGQQPNPGNAWTYKITWAK